MTKIFATKPAVSKPYTSKFVAVSPYSESYCQKKFEGLSSKAVLISLHFFNHIYEIYDKLILPNEQILPSSESISDSSISLWFLHGKIGWF